MQPRGRRGPSWIRETSVPHPTTDPAPDLAALCRVMLLSRATEERLRSLYRQGRVAGGVYLGIGHEALSGAAGLHLRSGDVYTPLIRDSAGRLAFGEPPADAFRCYLGKRTGPMRGRDGNIHRGDPARGDLPMISHLGGMLAPAAGIMLARRLRGEADANIALCSIGEGGMACGATHEALNAIAVHRLPVVTVVANNGFSYSTANDESFACEDLVARAAAYGMPGYRCDGTDPQDCLDTLGTAVGAARSDGTPQLVVATLLRLCGHGEHDDATYVPEELLARTPDCLAVAREQALAAGIVDAVGWDAWWEEATATVDAALAEAEAEPDADAASEDWRAWSGDWPGLEGVA